MSLTGVEITSEVWLTCVTHALSTEKEEIMGLLLGDVLVYGDGRATARIFSAAPQTRSDRQKDRVETNPEQLAAAATEAERLSLRTGQETRVIGWYHSHPHITVFPSHVDVATQGMYQMLDRGFIGLIFSCFSEDANRVGRIQVTAFQAAPANRRPPTPLPIHLAPSRSPSPLPPPQAHLPSAPDLPPLSREHQTSPARGTGSAAPAGSDSSIEEVRPPVANVPPRIRGGGPSSESEEQDPSGARRPPRPPSLDVEAGPSQPTGPRSNRISPSPYYPSESQRKGWSYAQAAAPRRESSSDSMHSAMEEAAARSMEDNRGANFVHKEVPLRIISGLDVIGSSTDLLLDPLVALQRMLFAEEKAAYRQAIAQSSVDGKMHPLAAIHHSATYQASLCKLIEYCLSPVLTTLWERQHQCQLQLAFLEQEERELRERAAAPTRTPSGKLLRPSSARTRPAADISSEKPASSTGQAAPSDMKIETSLSWRGRKLLEMGDKSAQGRGKEKIEDWGALDAAGKGMVERVREAQLSQARKSMEGQETEEPLIRWE